MFGTMFGIRCGDAAVCLLKNWNVLTSRKMFWGLFIEKQRGGKHITNMILESICMTHTGVCRSRRYYPLSSPMVRCGPLWSAVVGRGPLWSVVVLCGPLWSTRISRDPPPSTRNHSVDSTAIRCGLLLSTRIHYHPLWSTKTHCDPLGLWSTDSNPLNGFHCTIHYSDLL